MFITTNSEERSSGIVGIRAMWMCGSVGWNISRSGKRERNMWCDNETRRLGVIISLMNRDLRLYVMTSGKRKLNNGKKQKTVITAATTHVTAALFFYLITIFLC